MSTKKFNGLYIFQRLYHWATPASTFITSDISLRRYEILSLPSMYRYGHLRIDQKATARRKGTACGDE
jgi:hypothetical protein